MWANVIHSGLPSEKQFAECFLSDSADKQGTNYPGIHRETGLVWIGIDESHVNLQTVTTFLEILELVAFFTVHVTTLLVDTSWWVEWTNPFWKNMRKSKMENIFPQQVQFWPKKNTPKTPPKPLTRLLERDIIGAASSPICFWRCNNQNSRACEGPKAPGLVYDTNVDASRNFPTI